MYDCCMVHLKSESVHLSCETAFQLFIQFPYLASVSHERLPDIQPLGHVMHSALLQQIYSAVSGLVCSNARPLGSLGTLGSLLSSSALGQEVGPALGDNSWMER